MMPTKSFSNSHDSKAAIDEDLQLLQEAHAYLDWSYSFIQPYLGQRILELGSGIGNYSEKLLNRERILASDMVAEYVQTLKKKFRNYPSFDAILLDLGEVTPANQARIREERIDTIIAMNVLEHVEDDHGAVKNLFDCICPAGRFIIVSPAIRKLFNQLDTVYGHFRRYDKDLFKDLASDVGAELETVFYFNALGVLGWWVNGTIRRQVRLPKLQTRIFNRIVPILRAIEGVRYPPFGLSIFAVLRKKSAS